MDQNKNLKQQLVDFMEGGHAHKPFNEAVGDLPEKLINSKPENVPYTFWQLLEHIRITQKDIINFVKNPHYVYLDWPKDYWPDSGQQADKKMWDSSVEAFNNDLNIFKKIIKNPKTDLLARIPHGEGQTILREILLVIDHNAYHIGEMILMRRAMGIWG